MRIIIFLLLLLNIQQNLKAQVRSSDASVRLLAAQKRQQLLDSSLVRNIPFTAIGPTVMSGRVSDLEVNRVDPTEFLVSYASGGLWHTQNNGTTFSPLFDHEAVMTIGDFAVDWNKNVIWIGTGEVNSSRSSYAGVGMYRSGDGGKTWQHRGLSESHHIGKVVLHPTNPDIVWVAALGHLYSNNFERGVFLTTDGGLTWQHTLAVSDSTGAVDLLLDPNNPNILYAATWERSRKAWDFKGAGKESNIYRSADAGVSWQLVTGEKSGFPAGSGKGRIGLTATAKGDATILLAVIDRQDSRQRPKNDKTPDLDAQMVREMDAATFLAVDTLRVAKFLENNYPPKYGLSQVRERIRTGTLTPALLADYLGDANRDLFETEVIGPEIYRSDDKGTSWRKVNDTFIDDCFNTYGYYFGQLRVSPGNADRLYLMGVPLIYSADGGKTWIRIDAENGHADHHALWINPTNPDHLINGNDGGINISYDNGKNWIKCNSPAVGQLYAVAVDEANPFHVYAGLQDNGVWYAENGATIDTRWHATGHNPYREIMGGDGMQIAIDPRDNNTIYTGYQFGNYFRLLRSGSRLSSIQPQHELGQLPYRWNWQSPIHLSKHLPDVVYFGGNRVFRSFNQGKTFVPISPDLTLGKKQGNVPFGTISTLHESPLAFGLLYAGTDDGQIWRHKGGISDWERVSDALPQGFWVSRVQASAHQLERVYVTLNGYRQDHFESYVFCSNDFGNTWQRLGLDLPAEPVNVIREDPENAKLLYVGTDHGLYCSVDGGTHFMTFHDENLPYVAVHDLALQAREHQLIVGTHGRSMFKADVSQLQKLDSAILVAPLHIFEVPNLEFNQNWGDKAWTWADEADLPYWEVPIFLSNTGEIIFSITTEKGDLLYLDTLQLKKGLQTLSIAPQAGQENDKRWRNLFAETTPKLAANGMRYLPTGNYKIVLRQGKIVQTTKVKIIEAN